MKKNSVKDLSSFKELIKKITDQNSFTLQNEEVETIRKEAIDEIRKAGIKDLSDIFGKKHKKNLSGYKNLNLLDIPKVRTRTSVQDHNQEIAGRRVIGRIKICDDEIIKWIDPNMKDKGIIFCDLFSAFSNHSKKINHAFMDDRIKRDNLISNLILGQSKHGSFLFIPDGIQPNGLFEIDVEVSHVNSLIPLHLITKIGKSASSKLVIQIKSKDNNINHSILAIRNDLFLAENSNLTVFQNQNIGIKTALFITEHIYKNRGANLNNLILDQGSAVTDRILDADLIGEGGSVIITGLYESRNGQRFFYDTQQNHFASHTKSDLLFKGVLGKNAFSFWKGNILVSKNTIGTNGYQSNKNLIIDPSAKAESIPGLEILTDDVRCSHGVTMGNIDKEQMFYLQSRGINQEDAEKIIIEGFLSSAVKRIADKRIQEFILNSIEK